MSWEISARKAVLQERFIESKVKRDEENCAGLHEEAVRFKIHQETSWLSSALSRASAGPVLEPRRGESRGTLTK